MIYSSVLLNSSPPLSSSSSSPLSLAYIPQCTLRFSLFGAHTRRAHKFFGSAKRVANRSANMGGHAIVCCGTPRAQLLLFTFGPLVSIELNVGRRCTRLFNRHTFLVASRHTGVQWRMARPMLSSNAIQSFNVPAATAALRLYTSIGGYMLCV